MGLRLTDLSIRTLKPPTKGSIVYADAIIAGLGVRVSQGGTKSFVLTHGALRRRETIGRVGILGLQDARREAKRRLAEYTLGKAAPASVTWDEAIAAFLAEAERRLKPRTFTTYRYFFTRYFRFGDLKLSALTHGEIQRRIDRLAETPVEQHHAFTVLRTFLRWAHRKHFLDTNPMERMASSYRYRPRTRILTDDELKRVWNAAGDDSFGTIVKALILIGQRAGEITNLSLDMVSEGSVTFPDWFTKNGREHTFPIGPLAHAHILRLPMRVAGERTKLPFMNYQRHKARLDTASGVSGWTLHDLRRTFASGLAAIGVQLPVIERLLNHVSGSFGGIVGVYQRYDFMPEMRDAIARWECQIQKITQD